MTMGGLALGAAITGLIMPRAPSNDILNNLIKNKPEFYKFVDIDLSTARTNQPYDEPGTFIWVDNQFARGEVTLTLNELQFGRFDLRRQKYIQGPFYRFFITNGAGQGAIRLFVSRGYQAASEPIEAINRAELAARLGSIVTFDRRGDVLWMDDFESGIKRWLLRETGVDTRVTWSADYSNRGGFCVKLLAGTGVIRQAGIIFRNSYPTVSRFGLEVSWARLLSATGFDLDLVLYDGTYGYQALIKYEDPNRKWEYTDEAAGWQTLLTDYSSNDDGNWWHTAKLVVDLEAKRFVRAILGPNTVDMSDMVMYSWLDATTPHLMARVGINGVVAGGSTYLIDNVILTQNEP